MSLHRFCFGDLTILVTRARQERLVHFFLFKIVCALHPFAVEAPKKLILIG